MIICFTFFDEIFSGSYVPGPGQQIELLITALLGEHLNGYNFHNLFSPAYFSHPKNARSLINLQYTGALLDLFNLSFRRTIVALIILQNYQQGNQFG